MSGKSRNFPLPLSSVMGDNKKKRWDTDFPDRLAMPQTAVKNVLDDRFAIKTAEKLKPATAREKVSSLPVTGYGTKNNPLLSRGAMAMVEKIAAQGVREKSVLAAMSVVPRHLFVESGLAQQAYVDTALPIGHQQTISRPYIVARMIEAICANRNGKPLARVMEIGTGCGYQAAVLSQVAKDVYSIERIKALHELAKKNLRVLRIPNLRLIYGDGMPGLPDVAPFDAIVVAAAGLQVPEVLYGQLAVGGRLIAPIGNQKQALQLTERTGERQWQSVMLEDCHFVPLLQGMV